MLERWLQTPCLARRWAELAVILRAAHRTSSLPDIGVIGQGTARNPTSTEWESAVAAGTSAHMPAATARRLRSIYSVSADWFVSAQEKQRLARSLAALEHAPGRIDPDLLAAMVGALQDVGQRTDMNAAIADYAETLLAQERIRLAWHTDLTGDHGASAMKRRVADSAICRALLVDGRPFQANAP